MKAKLISKKKLLKKYRFSTIPMQVLRSKFIVPAPRSPTPKEGGKQRPREEAKRLSDGAKLLYAELLAWVFQKKDGTEGQCRPHQAVLAENLDTSVNTIQRRLSELQRAKLIRVVLNRNSGKPSIIRFCRSLTHLCSYDRAYNRNGYYQIVLEAARDRRQNRKDTKQSKVPEDVAPIIKLGS